MKISPRINLLLPLLVVLLGFYHALVLPGCANIIPPSGGPRDTLPPMLLDAAPPDSARGFNNNEIVFTFDEYVDIQNVQQNLIVSPTPKIFPVVTNKLRTITVRLKDTLEPNTTYSLNFGKAIKDVNEGNVAKDFTYIFSTGNYIDSLTLAGRVILAETGKTDSTMIAMLHVSPRDSAVITDNPRYITRLDSSGRFLFRNLPAGTFYLYAIKDESTLRRYLKESQLFAFAEEPVVVSQETEPVLLYAYQRAEAKQAPSFGNLRNNQQPQLRFLTNLQNNTQDLLGPFELTFEVPLASFDSTKMHLYTDSSYTTVTPLRILPDSNNQVLTLRPDWQQDRHYHLVLDKDFATDTLGQQIPETDTLHFATRKESEYGSLRLRIRNLEKIEHPVLLFVQNNKVVEAASLSGEVFLRNLFPAGDFELRILSDTNQNGRYDPGDFFHGRVQPEHVVPVQRDIKVRANWQNEIEIAL